MLPRYKRFTLGTLTLAVLAVGVFGSFGYAEPARAQWSVNELTSIPNTVNTVKSQILGGLKSALLGAASRILSYAMRKIAYDGAVWLASGGKGQQPLAFNKGFGDYLKNVGNDALGHGIEALGSKFGMDLCKLPDIKTDLALRMGLRTGFQMPNIGGGTGDPTQKPACSFSEFTKNWTDGAQWQSKFDTAQKSMTEQLNGALSFTQGGAGGLETVLVTTEKINQTVQAQVAASQLGRTEGQGYKEKTAIISDQIKTPSGIIKKEFESNTPGDLQAKDEAQMQALLTTGDIKVIPNVLASFLSTLVSTMVKNYQEQGILPFGAGCTADKPNCLAGQTVATYEGAGVISNRAAAQDLFSSFLVVKINSQDNYDVLSELGNCEGKGVYNCRADEGLVQAARITAGGDSITIADALKYPGQPLLRGDWKLIPYKNREADNAQNSNTQVCKTAYCEANIKVLRQIRMLPLGFEIAAHNSDPDRPWTLQQVVDGFTKCNYGPNGAVIPDPKYPFCHLIDPNWVIKVPETRCNAKVDTAVQLTKDAPTRLEDCVDLSSCVAYNADGSCANFAYCARERNTWDFGPADRCEQQWRTCKMYTDTVTGANVSYLQRTLDTGSCGQSDVGCRAYSLYQDAVNKYKWVEPTAISVGNNYTQQSIFFNNQLPQTCSANSDGCTAYQVASSTDGDFRYLRKAPDYLGCYDSNSNRADGIQWPQTTTDLNSLPKNAACKQYAGACTYQEVGCAMYTSKNSGDQVPGKISQQNVCADSCVGYNAYQEMPSHYSNGKSVTYAVIQPNSGPQCKESEVGCSSFTNLSTAIGGQENVEYFSYLRPCELPQNTALQGTFTTFEGATQGGFQLKTYTLVTNVDGSPFQWEKVPGDAAGYKCSEKLYKDKQADNDCRQFNDAKGSVFYARLDKTVPVSDQCTPYRLNSSELNPVPLSTIGNKAACEAEGVNGFWNTNVVPNRCELCFQNGKYNKDGYCTYFGLPAGVQNSAYASESCSAAVESCREYKGNEGFNVKIYPTDTFETQDVGSLWFWTGNNMKLSKESTKAGEQSLGFVGAANVANRVVSSTPGQSYLVSFWAKGAANNVTVKLVANLSGKGSVLGQESISDTWRLYTLGPVKYSEVSGDARVQFDLEKNGALFIDNFSIQRINGVEYRVKNKLTVPLECDADPTDNLPGAALGCSIYTNPLINKPVPLTGFDFLCREEAIGCFGFIDTHNTLPKQGENAGDEKKDHLYKVFLTGNGKAGKWELEYKGTKLANCTTVQGEKGCNVDVVGVHPDALINDATTAINGDTTNKPVLTASTIYIPADKVDSAVYLVNNKDLPGQCSAQDLGCVTVGFEKQTPVGPEYTTGTIKNDPALYSTTLCKQESVGCSAFNDSKGGTTYFRDPTVVGQKLCEYRVDEPVAGGKSTGWFWKDVGSCKGTNNLCTKDDDCDGTKDSCDKTVAKPCYENYVDGNGQFGLWSYGDTGKYQDFVGMCKPEFNGCSEYVDHNNIDANGSARAEYFIDNEKISEGDCNGSVSLKAGCTLFDATANPSKYWSTADTYKASADADGVAVKPVVGNVNDANKIIKVEPNRECSEWVQCRRAVTVWDPTTGKPKSVCQEIGRCTKADPANPTKCISWVDDSHALSGQPLNQNAYVMRATVKGLVDWSSREFSGYSIFNQFPLEELDQANLNPDPKKPDWRLVKEVACGGGQWCDVQSSDSPSPMCSANAPKDGSQPCGASGEGACYNGKCVRAIETAYGNNTVMIDQQRQICRAYPEPDAPFPNTDAMGKINGSGSQLFNLVNVCNENKAPQTDPRLANLCECDYTKVKYGDAIVRYWNYQKPAITEKFKDLVGGVLKEYPEAPPGICLSGEGSPNNKDPDAACTTDKDCTITVDGKTIPGVCQKQTSVSKQLGWKGFCLEYDMSRTINGNENEHPCLTWYPIDTLSGAADINSQRTEAGYLDKGLPFYCVNSNGGASFDRGNAAGWLGQIFNDALSLRNVFSYKSSLYIASLPDYNNFGARMVGVRAACSADLTSAACHTEAGVLNALDSIWNGTPLEKYGAPYFVAQYISMTGQMAREERTVANTPFDKNPGQVNMANVEKIVVEVEKGDDEDPRAGARFEIYPNDFTAPIGSPQNVYNLQNGNGEPGNAATGRYLGRPNQFVVFYGGEWGNKTPYLDSTGKRVCFGESACESLDGNLFAVNGLTVKTRPGQAANSTEGIWNAKAITRNEDLCPWTGDFARTRAGGGNWNAVRFRFDPATLNFDGYDTAYCDDSAGSGEIKYKITFQLKEWCPVLGNAKSPSTDVAHETVAWTNRLWKESKFVLPNPFGLAGGNYSYDVADTMFGKLRLNSVGFNNADQVNLTGEQPTADGECYGITGDDCKHTLSTYNSYVGAPYSCSQGTCVRNNDANPLAAPVYPDVTPDDGRKWLGSLFAKISNLNVFSPTIVRNGQSFAYAGYDTRDDNKDYRQLGDPNAPFTAPKAPRINPIVEGTCAQSGDVKGLCKEDQSGQGGMSINGKSNGIVKVFNPADKVYAQFYMYADDNQMPIRNVTVDWTGKSDIKLLTPRPGYFYNQRGLAEPYCLKIIGRPGICVVGNTNLVGGCTQNSDCGAGLQEQCVTPDLAKSFGYIKAREGQTPSTCDSHYYETYNVYSCTETTPGFTKTGCGDDDTQFPNGCCVFKPRVQVKDNWGWCNGTCNPNSKGCFGGNNTEGKCTDPLAWTEFAGTLIVAPVGAKQP